MLEHVHVFAIGVHLRTNATIALREGDSKVALAGYEMSKVKEDVIKLSVDNRMPWDIK